jgi:hypothetical protein
MLHHQDGVSGDCAAPCRFKGLSCGASDARFVENVDDADQAHAELRREPTLRLAAGECAVIAIRVVPARSRAGSGRCSTPSPLRAAPHSRHARDQLRAKACAAAISRAMKAGTMSKPEPETGNRNRPHGTLQGVRKAAVLSGLRFPVSVSTHRSTSRLQPRASTRASPPP